MFNITEMADELEDFYRGQSTPMPVRKEDYIKFVVRSIVRLYVDRNEPGEYDRTAYTTDEDGTLYYDVDLDIVKQEYIFILSKIRFMQMIQNDVSGDGAVSYTTNALSVTGAKEGYKSVKQILDDLELDRVRVFHKMMANEG